MFDRFVAEPAIMLGARLAPSIGAEGAKWAKHKLMPGRTMPRARNLTASNLLFRRRRKRAGPRVFTMELFTELTPEELSTDFALDKCGRLAQMGYKTSSQSLDGLTLERSYLRRNIVVTIKFVRDANGSYVVISGDVTPDTRTLLDELASVHRRANAT